MGGEDNSDSDYYQTRMQTDTRTDATENITTRMRHGNNFSRVRLCLCLSCSVFNKCLDRKTLFLAKVDVIVIVNMRLYTVSQKTVQNCFCQNFVKFPPILIIFDRKMAKRLKLCEMHSFSTSPNSRHHFTVLNADIQNCTLHNAESCYPQQTF